MKQTMATDKPDELPSETREVVNGSTHERDDHVETEQRNNNNAQDTDTYNSTGNELEVEDTALLDSNGRNKLFQKGLLYEQDDQQELALKCYLGCLNGLKQDSNFSLLPQCLRNVADIYYKKEDYQKAVQFIQAEKLFYENALIDITALGKGDVGFEDINGTSDQPNVEKVRAEEYEQLAKLCLERKQPHLALEYAGKATKIRQSVFGSNDACTQESLDFFATVYAEVGKQQYSDSMGKMSSERENEIDSINSGEPGVEKGTTGETTPSSILRNRKQRNRPRSAQHVRFVDVDGTTIDTQTDNRQQELALSNRLLVVLFVICTMLLSLLGFFLYCRLFMESSPGCIIIKSYVHYFLMKIKYYYYYFSSSKLLKYV